MKMLKKIDSLVAAIIGGCLLIVGIVMLFVEGDFSSLKWDDWYFTSIPFILWAIYMRIFAYTQENKKKE